MTSAKEFIRFTLNVLVLTLFVAFLGSMPASAQDLLISNIKAPVLSQYLTNAVAVARPEPERVMLPH